ncbi:DUF4942 domain-containing protein [Brevundimonas sp. LF-1]|uniref:DUF4942 domain-containing protein n=1 Tax=Brevundimonas sp. LF-1 TaxID=3126100 RepID=UPI0030E26529
MSALIARSTVVDMEAHRDHALELYAQAFDTLQEAAGAHGRATMKGWALATSLSTGRYHGDRSFAKSGDREEFLEECRRQIDRAMWDHLIMSTGIEQLMDKQEREAFRLQLAENPPEATSDNILATFERLAGDAQIIFQRGLAQAFSRLDRRFRSHDGFKIGSRIVFNNAFSDGHWNHYSKKDEDLRDVERVFTVLDGKKQPERSAGIIGTIDAARPRGWGAQAFEADGEYFKIRVFKNGNVHCWFKRDDLVEKVNLVLADFYGAAIGAAPDVADRKHEVAQTPARNFGFFETPMAAGARALEALRLKPGMSVLEPSAGKGALANLARAAGGNVTCVEIQPDNAGHLRALGYARVIQRDFLQTDPATLGTFDRILMNPPFDRGRDVDHVTHAMRFLKPGGRLVSIMAAGVEYRADRKTSDFRATVERFGGEMRDLPFGSFAESGTNVNTVIVTLQTPPHAANDNPRSEIAA